ATAGLLDVRFQVASDAAGFLLLGERDMAEARRTLLGKSYRCVGRDREISILEGLYDDCVNEPVAKVALLTGGAGRGETRVRWGVMQRLKDRPDPPQDLL